MIQGFTFQAQMGCWISKSIDIIFFFQGGSRLSNGKNYSHGFVWKQATPRSDGIKKLLAIGGDPWSSLFPKKLSPQVVGYIINPYIRTTAGVIPPLNPQNEQYI